VRLDSNTGWLTPDNCRHPETATLVRLPSYLSAFMGWMDPESEPGNLGHHIDAGRARLIWQLPHIRSMF
jgi:hypothetical protein